MQTELSRLSEEAVREITAASDLQALEAVRVKYLGKKGLYTDYLKSIGGLPPADRARLGKEINTLKDTFLTQYQHQKDIFETQTLHEKLNAESIDVTLPGRGQHIGSLHPVTRATHTIIEWFSKRGFQVIEGPDIEDDYHNFEALNIPEHHPARAMHDTFYLPDNRLLRTHTSPVQIRVMSQNKPPFRLITTGRTYRCDHDATHTPMFHQCEVLVVDTHIHFGHLKRLLEDFLPDFFEKNLEIRFRASYFPFTEPSAEVDINSPRGWLEVLGCGMVHPKVLQNCNIDPEIYSGFALGMGIERLAMLKYGINDIRLLFENDLRFLEQFQHGL